ncbi:MAG: type IV secretion system DNA-binding domain-containing protein [Acidimicrobiia bacterium]|nr:type IV secretion system DNA-binding domain-containing protein [Acidimicrobiia bacterium]
MRKTATKKKKSSTPTGVLAQARMAGRDRFVHQADDIWGLVMLVVGLILLLGFFSFSGPLGDAVVTGLRFLFGVWAILVPTAILLVGLTLIIGKVRDGDHARLPLGLGFLFFGSLGLFHLLSGTEPLAAGVEVVADRGGVIGALISFPIRRVVGLLGAFIILSAVIGVGALIVTRSTLREAALAVGELGRTLVRRLKQAVQSYRRPDRPHVQSPDPAPVVAAKKPERARPPRADQKSKRPPVKKPEPEQPIPRVAPNKNYVKPPLDLLSPGRGGTQDKRSLEATGRELEATLRQHGVDARLVRIVPGPTVTRYEIELAPGVKVNKITSLTNDIGYALATPDVRILAPIPGKSAVGVEVPNKKRRLVTLKDILDSPEARENDNPLAVALGMNISGRPVMVNLNELPHVLIAGATGAGKSSCINALVTSILVRALPEEVRLILVDPKRVEMGQYDDVPHLLTKVITNPKKAADALNWAVDEMDRRYQLLADAGVRDITGYHEKWDAGGLETDSFDRFPYIVIVVDELNDLMMVAGKVVESSIVRIAQMARAIGIHLVLATQRPSVNVITGVIKANVPSRMAFSVASQADSRVILDSVGAEKLIGLGDLLVVTARDPKPERIQGAFVEESEIGAVAEWVREQGQAQYDERMFKKVEAQAKAAEDADGEDPELLKQAIELVVRSQLGSTSMLQRKLRVGFARAGRLMDILERRGVVGPSEGSKAREVLIRPEELEEFVSGAAVT